MMRIPEKLMPYIDFEEGEMIAHDLPNDLRDDFEELKNFYDTVIKKDDFTDY